MSNMILKVLFCQLFWLLKAEACGSPQYQLYKPCPNKTHQCCPIEPDVCRACPCPPGYRRCPKTRECIDIDECAERNNTCVKNSQCINTPGSYQCGPCNPGYEGNQTVGCRLKPNFCPNGQQCDNNASCVSLGIDCLGGNQYICRCNIGWAGNGKICGPDIDLDGWPDIQLPCADPHCKKDNCPNIPNSGQEDAENDGLGNVCDPDPDNDGITVNDNCPYDYNPTQVDADQDGAGFTCDTCRSFYNLDQTDTDGDGIGDACDNDIDNDGVINAKDNCPKVWNRNQLDTDKDGKGDACDNCPKVPNPDQQDTDEDLVGDACDGKEDFDRDGISDDRDNCEFTPNPDQRDTDGDGIGDACDCDLDGDGVWNNVDNCVYVPNPEQLDKNRDCIGDACCKDYDGDKVDDISDNCPNNSLISKTDFRKYQSILLNSLESTPPPNWEIHDNGVEILQTSNGQPGLAVGYDRLEGVDFEGTLYVNTDKDDDYIGIVFSFQDNRNFYMVAWKKADGPYYSAHTGMGLAGVQIKLVQSATGPGYPLGIAIWITETTPNEVKLLWRDPAKLGWKHRVSYRWSLIHRPRIGLMRFKIFEGPTLRVDSGNVFDSTLQGGRLGVYSFSQEQVIWSAMKYRCNEKVPRVIWNELPESLRSRISAENKLSTNV